MSLFRPTASQSASRRRVLATLCAVGLAGCGQFGQQEVPGSTTESLTTNGENDAGTIDILTDYQGQEWDGTWDNVRSGWNERSDVPVRVEYPRGPQWPERLRTLVDEGRPPELYHCRLSEVVDLVARGATRPVGSLVDEFAAANGALLTDRTIGASGTTHLVPHGLTLGSVLCYRTDVYDELDLSVPETWENLRTNARTIDEADSFDGRGFAVAAGDPRSDWKAGADLQTWLANAGGGVWRWADRDRETAELDFDPAAVRQALELLSALSQYSPDPAELGYAETIAQWVQGGVAQCLFPNAWLAGEAADAGRVDLAANTAVSLAPLRDRGVDPIDRGWARVEGTVVFRDAGEADAATEFLRYLYEGVDRQAEMNLVDPMQYLPPYDGVLTSDTYRNAAYFEAVDGHLYDLNRHLVDDIAPKLAGDRPQTLATWSVRAEAVLSELVRAVVVDGDDVDAAVERTRSRLDVRLKTAQGRRET